MLSARLRDLRRSKRDTALHFPPQDLTVLEIIQVIWIFTARQLLYLLGWGNDFATDSGGGGGGEVYLVPDLRLSMLFRLTRDHITRYASAVGLADSDADAMFDDPAQLCLMLSAWTEPAFLLLLAHHKSPIRPLGAVNVGNRFELLHPERCAAEKLRCCESLAVHARLLPQVRTVRRGLEIDIEVRLVDDEDGQTLFRQVFTMLQFMKVASGLVDKATPQHQEVSGSGSAASAAFETSADLTIRWAAICKDYNPIHLSDFAAKAFGFPKRLVHGNHAFALALAALYNVKGKSVLSSQPVAYEMTVRFLRPAVVPSRLVVEERDDAGIQEFIISKDGRPSITGYIKAVKSTENAGDLRG